MKALPVLLICILLEGLCVAQAGSGAELQRRADQASGTDCVRLSMQVARSTMEAANQLFGTGDVKAAHENVDATVRYVKRSVTCSLQARKTQKATEIELRELIRRAKDIQKTLDSDDRPHLKQSVAELEMQRDKLLSAMFGAAGAGAAEKKP